MDKKKPDEQIQYMPIGMSIGIGVGVAIGAAMGNIPVCMCLGLGIGLCLETAVADTDTVVTFGREAVVELAAENDADTVINAIVGIAGLEPTLAAANAKKDIALANKETLVTGGELVKKAIKENGVKLLPVDSEHSAIFQCLQGAPEGSLNRGSKKPSGHEPGRFPVWGYD